MQISNQPVTRHSFRFSWSRHPAEVQMRIRMRKNGESHYKKVTLKAALFLEELIWDFSVPHPRWESPVTPHPRGTLLDQDLVTVEAICVQWTHRHVLKNSLRLFEIWDIRSWVRCSHKGDGHGHSKTNGIKVCQENIPPAITPWPLNCWHRATVYVYGKFWTYQPPIVQFY